MTHETQATTAGSQRDRSPKRIIVAVDGSENNRSAVIWASAEAAATGSDIALVTAVEDYLVPTPHFSVQGQDEHIHQMLAAVRDEVRSAVPERQVSIEAIAGSPVAVLLDRSEEAQMVVVGKRGLGSFARMIVGSTSIALAGRAKLPVIIVPHGWKQNEHDSAPLVVGIDPYRFEERPVQVAFERAKRLGVTLVAVHGWETPGVYSTSWGVAAAAETAAAWEREADAAFDKVLSIWRERFADVDVETVHARSHPATALLEAAKDGQMLVLGRRAVGRLGGFPLGSVTRAVLHYVECPVMVVPSESG